MTKPHEHDLPASPPAKPLSDAEYEKLRQGEFIAQEASRYLLDIDDYLDSVRGLNDYLNLHDRRTLTDARLLLNGIASRCERTVRAPPAVTTLSDDEYAELRNIEHAAREAYQYLGDLDQLLEVATMRDYLSKDDDLSLSTARNLTDKIAQRAKEICERGAP